MFGNMRVGKTVLGIVRRDVYFSSTFEALWNISTSTKLLSVKPETVKSFRWTHNRRVYGILCVCSPRNCENFLVNFKQLYVMECEKWWEVTDSKRMAGSCEGYLFSILLEVLTGNKRSIK